jgi:adenylylsulfate kinase-like enzyme
MSKLLIRTVSNGHLSHGQERLLALLLSGQNVYFTGKAGSGKSRVITEFTKLCSKKIAVTVS